jgi:hypothetical protein
MDTPAIETQEAPVKNWSLLASEAFGDQFKGDVSESPEPISEPEADPVTDLAADPVQAEASEEVPISSIDELATHYELDPEWMDSLEIPVKINGAESKAKLSDLKKNYQITEAAESRLREAKEKARAEMQVVAEKRETLNSQFAIVASLIEQTEKTLTKDESGINWDELRRQDPAEWTAKRAEFAQRREEIQRLKTDAVGSYQSTITQSQQEAQEQQRQYLQEQAQLLVEKLPEWKNPETAKTEKTAVAEYLYNQGFAQEDIAAASDHRMIVLARKAMLYDKGHDKAEVTKLKVTKIPKVLKPGTPKSSDQVASEKAVQAKSRLKQSGSLEDALAALRSKRG